MGLLTKASQCIHPRYVHLDSNALKLLHLNETWLKVTRRNLSQAQVSTALRPFYFLVHPDLLAKFPKEQAVNESSLKSLKMYLNVMIDDRKIVPNPITTTFYIKPRSQRERLNKTKLKSVRLHLTQEPKVRSAVIKILKGCDLPTSYVDSIPERKDESILNNVVPWKDFEAAVEEQESQFARRVMRQTDFIHSTDASQPLKKWLTKNVETARGKMGKSESMRLELERRQDELCNSMSMADITWDSNSGWETMHRIGTVKSFKDMCEHHFSAVKDILFDRTVVFGGTEGGLSLEGNIIIYTGEVRNNWLNTIRNIPKADEQLRKIPLVEKALSQMLRDIKIVKSKHQKSVTVDDYRIRLRKLITNMGDYFVTRSLPSQWPDTLSDLEMCIVTESCPLMVTPEGQILVPASCPGLFLVDFITKNMDVAKQNLAQAALNKKEEANLIIRCINELGLIQLDRDDSISSDAMIKSCQRLLSNASYIRHLTHGNHLVISRYYSVLSDGIICIPWNWIESIEEN